MTGKSTANNGIVSHDSAGPVHGSFKLSEWQHRRLFIAGIEESCEKAGVTVEWFSEYWVARLSKGEAVRYISAYLFPCNDAAAAGIARDKVAAYHVLKSCQVPAVPHRLIRFPPEISEAYVTSKITGDFALPVVLKPCDRGGGSDVFKVTTAAELAGTLMEMSARYRTIAASPFEEIIDEYRVIILDQKPLLAIRKVRAGNEWRHNLQFGARPAAVTDEALKAELCDLALAAARAIGLRLCAVDVITTPEGCKVIEVNAGFSMSKLSASPEFKPQVDEIYYQAVQACFSGYNETR